MSWSYRITILYLGFMGIIITLVTISMRNKEELVAPDYYSQEIKYQDKIDAINNAMALEESISHSLTDTDIVLSLSDFFKTKEIKGEIYFFCPSNSKYDLKTKMNFDASGKQILSKKLLVPAIYKMNLSWTENGKNYFKEEVITIK